MTPAPQTTQDNHLNRPATITHFGCLGGGFTNQEPTLLACLASPLPLSNRTCRQARQSVKPEAAGAPSRTAQRAKNRRGSFQPRTLACLNIEDIAPKPVLPRNCSVSNSGALSQPSYFRAGQLIMGLLWAVGDGDLGCICMW